MNYRLLNEGEEIHGEDEYYNIRLNAWFKYYTINHYNMKVRVEKGNSPIRRQDSTKAEADRMREAIKDAAKLYDELAIMTDPLGSAVKYGPDFEPPTEEEWRESILEMRKALDDALLPPAAPEKAETCVWSKKNMMNGEKYTGSCGYTIIHPDYEGIIEKDCPGCGKPIAEGGEG